MVGGRLMVGGTTEDCAGVKGLMVGGGRIEDCLVVSHARRSGEVGGSCWVGKGVLI